MFRFTLFVLCAAALVGPAGMPLPAVAQKPPAELGGQLVTLEKSDIPLADALKEIAKQTGMTVLDRRRDKSNPKLKLALARATFWQALDAVAREADLQVYLFDRERQVALIEGPYREMPTSFQGPFRVTLKKLATVRDLALDAHFCLAEVELAWEPRFQGFLLEPKPDSYVVKDDKGKEREILPGEKGRVAVDGRFAMDFPVRFEAPARTSARLGLVQGRVAVIGSPKMLEFTFDELKPGQKLVKEDVSVVLDRVVTDGDLWTLGVSLRYPPGPALESFESSLVSNEMFLEHRKTRQRIACNAGSNLDQNDNQATARYHFESDPLRKVSLGKPADWRVVYYTPGKIVEVPVTFEFKDVPLP